MRLIVKKRIIDKVKIKDLCEQMGILSVNRMAAEEQLRIIQCAKFSQTSLVRAFQIKLLLLNKSIGSRLHYHKRDNELEMFLIP